MSNPDTFICFPSLSTWEKLHHLHFEMWEHWNWHNSSMLFFDVFPKWFIAPLLVYIINILRTSLEYILPSFSCIFWLKMETAHHAFDLIAKSGFPAHPKLSSIASEAFLSFAVLFCTFARHSAAQLLSKWPSSPLRDRHRDVASLQLLLADLLEGLSYLCKTAISLNQNSPIVP